MAVFRNLFGKARQFSSYVSDGHSALSIAKGLIKQVSENKEELGNAINAIVGLRTGKGLDNEHVLGRILEQCKLTDFERHLLNESVTEMRNSGGEEEQLADNFVIAIALGAPVDGKYPGTEIIHGFVHRINRDEVGSTEEEKRNYIKSEIRLIGHDAEIKRKASVVKWIAKEGWKSFDEKGAQAIRTLNDGLRQLYELDKPQETPRSFWGKVKKWITF